LPIDTKGFVAGLKDSQFTSPRELGELLARTPECQECVVKQLFRYMAGRQDTPADRPLLGNALQVFRNLDYRFKDLLLYLAKSRDISSGRGSADVASNHQAQ